MISINIPVYNFDVRGLVYQVAKQGEKLGNPFEIRVYDDGSQQQFKLLNREIETSPNVVYLELEKNMGRAAIRNKMGLDAKFQYLLFIDADSKIINENYLKNYLDNVRPNRVLCGGTAYSKTKPTEKEKLLRWVYGTNREAVSAETRNNKKGFIITSNNFLIEKRVFELIHFRDELKNYGHEDTLLGYDLFQNKIEIYHINNPVEHTGLEDAESFLEKTKLALENLHRIANGLLNVDSEFERQVHFLNAYAKITKYVPHVLLALVYKTFKKLMERNLKSKTPNLFWFDFYKLTFFATLK